MTKITQQQRLADFMLAKGVDKPVPIDDMFDATFGSAVRPLDHRRVQQKVGAVITHLHHAWDANNRKYTIAPHPTMKRHYVLIAYTTLL